VNLAFASRQCPGGGIRLRRVGYLIGMVGLVLVVTVKISQAHHSAVRHRWVQRTWADKRHEWLQNLPA
jgi:hypothetical protein